MNSNPYDILKSSDFEKFIKEMGIEKISPSKDKQTFDEKLFNLNFYSLVGLKLFTLYPSVINFSQSRELTKASKQFLQFQLQRLRDGASIDTEICITMLFFIGIGHEMEEISNLDYALSCVPTFLIKIVKKLSVDKAQKDMAEKYESKIRKSIFHCTSSVLCLLVHYYIINNKNIDQIKHYTVDILNAYNSSINIREFMNISFTHILNTAGISTILELYKKSSFISNYKSSINNNEIIENIKLYCEIKKEELITEAEYCNTFISESFSLDKNDYNKNIHNLKNNYFRFLCPSYSYLLRSGSMCYNDIVNYNIRMKKWDCMNLFDHLLVYYLAAWIKENRNYKWIENINKEELARDITNCILEKQT